VNFLVYCFSVAVARVMSDFVIIPTSFPLLSVTGSPLMLCLAISLAASARSASCSIDIGFAVMMSLAVSKCMLFGRAINPLTSRGQQL